MEYIVSAAQMKAADQYTSEHFGLSSDVLMERAALAVADVIDRTWRKRRRRDVLSSAEDASPVSDDRSGGPRVLIFAGSGGNGGDGIALARILHQRGLQVLLVAVGEVAGFHEIARRQIDMALKYGVHVITLKDPSETEAVRMVTERRFHFVVDAIFGVGLTRGLGGVYASAVALILRLKELEGDELCVLSVDMPSGIHTDTGEVCGIAVRADITVTMNHRKRGQILYPGALYAGEVVVADAGITADSFANGMPDLAAYDEPVRELKPTRNPAGNKGTFGKLLIIAGNGQIGGAAILAARGAYAAGAGMVRVFTEKKNRTALLTAVPEALIDVWDEESVPERMEETLRGALAWANAVVIGPGIGTGQHGAYMLKQVLKDDRLPLILDADACNLVAGDSALREAVRIYRTGAGDQSNEEDADRTRAVEFAGGYWPVMTPHLGEFARLTGKEIRTAAAELLTAPKQLADELGCTVLCKDARSIVARAGSAGQIINYAGCSGMATAGSGDVLAGIIGTLAAQGASSMESAAIGCRLHALAGEAAAARCGEASMTACDIAASLREILK